MLNPLLNPFESLPLLKSSILDPGRLKRSSPESLKRYQDKSLRKIVKYAYRVPLYHDKYKKAGIHPSDIKGIDDIVKIPMVSKDDLRSYFPDGLVPKGYNKEKVHVICTGGTTGKSVSLFTEFLNIGQAGQLQIREMGTFGLNWRSSRNAHIGNLNECRVDQVVMDHFFRHMGKFFSIDNRVDIDVSTPIREIVNRLNSFKPEVIFTYPAIFQQLAFQKRKGLGENIKPKVLYCGGSVLDEYTRIYVEDAFGCPLLNTYRSVEANGIIASECKHHTWHIHSDFYFIEAVDDNLEPVKEGKNGHIVLTRIFGRGTPIIRYTGIDDWIKIQNNFDCGCGLKTPVLVDGVKGRKKGAIVLPNGRVFPPGAFCFIEPVLTNHKTFKVKQYQVIQKKVHEIEILLVIDENLRDIGVSVDTIKKEIKERYRVKTGPDVKITVREVDKIKHLGDASKPVPIVVSHVKPEDAVKYIDGGS